MKFNQWKTLQKEKTVVKTTCEVGQSFPPVFDAQGCGIELAVWYRENKEMLLQELRTAGAVLFRRFDMNQLADFETFVSEAIGSTGKYIEGATPRSAVSSSVYTSTEFPADHEIALHNELSYVTTPPHRLSFYCVEAAEAGGQTQLADTRMVLSLLDPAVVAEFERRGGWSLIRNFGFGMGPAIAKSFGTDDPDELRDYCRRAAIDILAMADGRLKTRQVRSVVHAHPVSGEASWFNHVAFWHPSSLPTEMQETLAKSFAVSDFPFSTYYGDGTEIPTHVVEHIRQAYVKAERKFDWKKGDVLLVDNWSVAHGRKPFKGARKVLVAMG